MRSCPHPFGFVRDIDAHGTQYGQAVSRWCFKCRDYLTLGPARDTPEVLGEVRAAEIAAIEVRIGKTVHTIRDGIVPYGMSGTEDEGWFSAEVDSARVLLEDTDDRIAARRAGWHAHAIAYHGEAPS